MMSEQESAHTNIGNNPLTKVTCKHFSTGSWPYRYGRLGIESLLSLSFSFLLVWWRSRMHSRW